MTDLIPHQFLDMHRSEDPTVTALFFEPSKGEGGPSGSSKVKGMASKALFGLFFLLLDFCMLPCYKVVADESSGLKKYCFGTFVQLFIL